MREKNKPERVFGLQVRCKELDIFKIRNLLRNCLEIVWIFSRFFGGNFFEFSWIFLRIFGFFVRIFLRGFFREDFLGMSSLYTLLKSTKLL